MIPVQLVGDASLGFEQNPPLFFVSDKRVHLDGRNANFPSKYPNERFRISSQRESMRHRANFSRRCSCLSQLYRVESIRMVCSNVHSFHMKRLSEIRGANPVETYCTQCCHLRGVRSRAAGSIESDRNGIQRMFSFPGIFGNSQLSKSIFLDNVINCKTAILSIGRSVDLS